MTLLSRYKLMTLLSGCALNKTFASLKYNFVTEKAEFMMLLSDFKINNFKRDDLMSFLPQVFWIL